MSNNAGNKAPYSVSDILKYLKGELSAREMHDLEKSALEDPFLADALEGMEKDYRLRGEDGFLQDIMALKKKLAARLQEEAATAGNEKKAAIPIFRSVRNLAAVLILLLGAGLTFYLVLDKSKKGPAQLAISPAPGAAKLSPGSTDNTAPARNSDSADNTVAKGKPASGTSSNPPGNSLTDDALAQAKKTEKDLAYTRHETEAIKPIPAKLNKDHKDHPLLDSTDDVKDTSRLASNMAFDKANANKAVASQEWSPAIQPGLKVENRFRGAANMSRAQNFMSNGLVTDEKNHPISGARVYMKENAGFSTITDQNGQFRLKLPEKDSFFNLTVASAGYRETSLVINPRNNIVANIVRLEPQPNTLNEVVVTSYGPQKRKSIPDVLTQNAVPVIGWKAYHDYLDSAKNTAGLDSTIKGNVIVSFDVDVTGALSSFSVIKSLSPSHDSVTLHLLLNGPRWKVQKGNKAKASVVVNY